MGYKIITFPPEGEDGFIRYEAYSKYAFTGENRFSIPIKDEKIKNIEICFEEQDEHGKAVITFYIKKSIEDFIEAKNSCDQKMEELIRTLSLYKDIHFLKYSYHITNMILDIRFGDSDFDISINVPIKVTNKDLGKISNTLSSKKAKKHLVRLYYEAKDQAGIVERYLLLYSVLSKVHGSQSRIDEYIIDKEPDVELRNSTSPYKQGESETIYTFLRNQVEHPQINTSFLEIQNKMTVLISRLDRHVKCSIIKKIN